MAVHRDTLAGERLDSWKEIAVFFGRAERTVKRWETERGLPVHRLPGTGKGSVFAYTKELADWLKGRSEDLDAEDTASGQVDVEHKIGKPEVGSGPASADIGPSAAAPAATVKSSISARVAAWVAPFILAGSLAVFLMSGHRDSRFKALASRHAPNPEAQDLYLKGRYFWDRRTPEDLNKAVDYFTQAIVKDPSDAQAYVGLADCYNLLREFGAMAPSEAYPRAISAAQRAVELDDTSAEAHISLAFGTFWWSWKGVTAEREFKRGLKLNANLVRAHHWYATFLWGLHRFPEAIDQMEQARRLEPASNAIMADKGLLLWDAGRHDEGFALLQQLEATQPSLSSTHDYLGRVYWQQKNYAKALAEWKRTAELRKDKDGLAFAELRDKGFAVNGLRGIYESEVPYLKDLVAHGSGDAHALARAYAALGKKQEALACLQVSFDRHEAAMLLGDPIPELLDEPEYLKFRAKVQELLTR